MKEVQISRRLKTVAGLVGLDMVLADVGCDHGYIPIYLMQKRQIPKAIAMDVNEGPLLRAKEHIQEWGLEEYIETRLSDGVKALQPGEVQSIVIAGMGGPLMEKIIREDGKYYPMMKAVHGTMVYNSVAEYRYGRNLLLHRHPVLKEFLQREQKKAEEIRERLKDSDTPSAKIRRAQMEEEENIRKEALVYYEM